MQTLMGKLTFKIFLIDQTFVTFLNMYKNEISEYLTSELSFHVSKFPVPPVIPVPVGEHNLIRLRRLEPSYLSRGPHIKS